MVKYEFIKTVDVERDLIFQISTDYENFTKILPDYFKELIIIEKKDNITKIQEKLEFLDHQLAQECIFQGAMNDYSWQACIDGKVFIVMDLVKVS